MKKLIILLVSILAVALFSGQSIAAEAKLESSTYTADQLIGLNVDNLKGKHVGIIRDVSLNSETGKIDFVILGKSLLGIGEDKFEVPVEALKIENFKESARATLVVPEITLLAAPIIASDETKAENNAYTAEQLIGRNVDNLNGEHVGKIRDVNFNSNTGEMNYVILGKSMLGIGEDTTSAVPLEALKIQNDEGNVTVTLIVSEFKLLKAPSMTTNESDENFRNRLQEYYCSSPEFGEDKVGLKQC